jgi:hypothetical protein
MKKALIAAAVAGAFVAPTAMAAEGPSVNIYYPLALTMGDTEANNGGASTADETVRDGGGSRLMFTWTDQLNNGMSLTAYASFGNLGHSEAGGVNTRNSFIALNGDHGSIAMGTMEHFFEIDAITDGYGADWALNGSAAGGEGLNFQRIGRTGFNFTRRDTNSVWWTGPQMNNLQLRAAYIMGPDATANDATDPEGYQIGAIYSMGGLNMRVAHASYDDYAANGTAGQARNVIDQNGSNLATDGTIIAGAGTIAGSNAEGTQFIFAYDFGSFSASVGMISMEQNAGVNNQFEASGYFASFIMPVEGGRIILNMGELGDQDINGQALQNSGISGMDIGYQHDLSANTYAFVRYQTQETGQNFDDNGATNAAIGANTAGNQVDTTGDVDSESSSFMAGIVFSY